MKNSSFCWTKTYFGVVQNPTGYYPGPVPPFRADKAPSLQLAESRNKRLAQDYRYIYKLQICTPAFQQKRFEWCNKANILPITSHFLFSFFPFSFLKFTISLSVPWNGVQAQSDLCVKVARLFAQTCAFYSLVQGLFLNPTLFSRSFKRRKPKVKNVDV